MADNDIQRIAEAALPQLPRLVEEWFPAGRWRGREYVVGDLGGSDGDSLSINTETGQWCDFATGETGGDVVSLYTAMRRLSGEHPQLQGAKELAAGLGIDLGSDSNQQLRTAPKRAKAKGGNAVPISPVPPDAPAPPDEFNRKGKDGNWEKLTVSYRWDYRDGEGHLLGHVCRFDLPDGGKEVVPQVYCDHHDGERRWRWLSFAKPRPLYGLDRLAAHPDAQVVIVEGEKAADAAQRLIGSDRVVVISWPGGGKALNLADWSPLAGRKVVIWPDNDEAGQDTAEGRLDDHGKLRKGLAQLLEPHAAGVRVVDPPADVAKGWDLADAERDGWSTDDVLGWIRQRVRHPKPRDPNAGAPDAAPMPDMPPEMDPSFDEGPPAPEIGESEPDPFLCVGYDHSAYYYLPQRSQQITRLPTSAHTKVNLLELAPLWWWERQFPTKNGVDWLRAADTLITINSRRVYDPSRIRGAGAWYDEGRAVLHLGDHLLVDGAHTRMIDINSRHIYEAGAAIEGDPVEHLSTREANELVQLCEMLEWDRPINGRLLAGWCVIAPICGAMQWRPHIWISGPSSAGKTWVAENIVKPCLGTTALPAQGNTTEAGIRQALRQDARPILFDEAEAEDRQGRQRIQSILDLARQASSEANGAILKGTTGGQSMVFRVRSAFCLISIGMSLQQQADQTRWTKLLLRKNLRRTAAEEFAAIEEKAATLLTPAYCAALRARSYRMIPVIRDNARIFSRAAAKYLGSQRLGDQMGALLAGCYALFSSRRITHDEAWEWLDRQDWEENEVDAVQSDEERLIAEIVQTPLRVDLERGTTTRSIAELIHTAIHGRDVDVDMKLANQVLARHGVKTQTREGKDYVLFSCSHRELRRLLADSPWSLSWSDILRRTEGAQDIVCARFGAKSTRAVAVPVQAVLGEDEEAAPPRQQEVEF